jgi:small-conductance mechanosensitive channel
MQTRDIIRPGLVITWLVLLAVHIAVRTIHSLPPDLVVVLRTMLLAAAVISVTWWVGDLLARLLARLTWHHGRSALRATGLVRNLVRITVISIGLLVLLATLGVAITPVLTTLGIGGVAVALGMQNTLANVFAGMQVTLARQISIGDRVLLETGQEGEVEDIGWGVSRIRADDGDEIVVPNGRLAVSVVIVRARPPATAPHAGERPPRAAHRRPTRRSRGGRTAGPARRTRTTGR